MLRKFHPNLSYITANRSCMTPSIEGSDFHEVKIQFIYIKKIQLNERQLDTKLLLSIDNVSSKTRGKQKNFTKKEANKWKRRWD